MVVYKLLELKALIIRLILTFTSDKYVLNVAPQSIILKERQNFYLA